MAHGSATPNLLPWLGTYWESLLRTRRSGRLPHALLISGPAGVGKRRLTALLAQSLLCPETGNDGFACGHCRDCLLLGAGTHPDLLLVGPEAEGKSDEIRVDAVRRLVAADALTAHRGRHKVIVIDPAQRMNIAAANSLLKTLEEPAPGTLLCLVCEQPNRLPATIRSRCQTLRLQTPAESDAVAWLKPQVKEEDALTLLRLASGAPLRALALAQSDEMAKRERAFSGFAAVGKGVRDPVAEAGAWSQVEPALLLSWLSGWVSDLLRVLSGHQQPRLLNPDKLGVLRELAQRIEPEEGHRYLRQVLSARSAEGAPLNALLLYESLLVEWARIIGRRKIRSP